MCNTLLQHRIKIKVIHCTCVLGSVETYLGRWGEAYLRGDAPYSDSIGHHLIRPIDADGLVNVEKLL